EQGLNQLLDGSLTSGAVRVSILSPSKYRVTFGGDPTVPNANLKFANATLPDLGNSPLGLAGGQISRTTYLEGAGNTVQTFTIQPSNNAVVTFRMRFNGIDAPLVP